MMAATSRAVRVRMTFVRQRCLVCGADVLEIPCLLCGFGTPVDPLADPCLVEARLLLDARGSLPAAATTFVYSQLVESGKYKGPSTSETEKQDKSRLDQFDQQAKAIWAKRDTGQ